MKKTLIAFGVGMAAVFSGITHAAPLPQTATTTFSVVNISQDNQDAQKIGARPGDILRYSFKINSQQENVVDYIASINVGAIQQLAEITDTGVGTITGSELTYPIFTKFAPCEQEYTFFVRVKPCNGTLSISANTSEGAKAIVPLQCGLTSTGSGNWMLLGGLGAIVVLFLFGGIMRRRVS